MCSRRPRHRDNCRDSPAVDVAVNRRNDRIYSAELEAPPGFEPGVEVLQTSALPLGDGAPGKECTARKARAAKPGEGPPRVEDGAGNGIRTRDFDLGKVALYH